MMRTLIIVIIVLAYLILGIPVLLIEWVIGKFNPRAKDYSCLRLVQACDLRLQSADAAAMIVDHLFFLS